LCFNSSGAGRKASSKLKGVFSAVKVLGLPQYPRLIPPLSAQKLPFSAVHNSFVSSRFSRESFLLSSIASGGFPFLFGMRFATLFIPGSLLPLLAQPQQQSSDGCNIHAVFNCSRE